MTTAKLPSVSVVVPAFDAARTITDCVRSLTALEYPRDLLEIIVVDNGSRDRTRALLESFGEAIRIVDEPRRGPAAARNAGVRSARGDVIAFTDADCTVDPRWLLPLVGALEDPGVGIAGGRILSRRPANAVELFGERIHDHRRALLWFEPPYAITMNWASRRAVLEAVGLFDVRLRRGEDGDLSYRIREHGYSFAYASEAIVYHRNQRTIAGLVREGWQHGFHAHPVRRRHASFIAAFRARIAALRVRPAERKRAASGPGGHAEDRSYERAFAFGKRTGRASGRVWFTFRHVPSEGAAPKPGRALLRLQRLALRTQRGPTRRVWSGLHEGVLGFVTRAIRWRERGTAVYVKGSFAFDDPVYGVSDIDMVVVTPDHPSRPGENRVRIQRRWQRLGRLAPPLRQLFQHSSVYEESELREVTDATCFTYGTGPDGTTRASHLGARPLPDELALLSHPPLSSPHREWRLVAGPERRNGMPISDAQGRRIAGWLDLQFLWKLAYLAAREPGSPRVPYLCVKLVADPVRILLWIAHGELVLRRKDALVRGLAVLPEEEPALRKALDLAARLDREATGSLAEFFPLFGRLSSRIAARIVADTAEHGATPVRLFEGAEPALAVQASARESFRRLVPEGVSPRLLPLVDWRALVMPPPPDETFAVVPGDGDALASISRIAQELPAGQHAALRIDGLLLKPARMLSHRTVQCAVTDPVSFALVDERMVAAFPDVPGWSAQDWARRAVAEHRAWLQSRRGIPDTGAGDRESVLTQLGRLLTASRAALFQESLATGEPELALSLAAVAERLRARDPEAGAVAEEAVAAYRSSRRDNRPVPSAAVGAMADVVRRLTAYRES